MSNILILATAEATNDVAMSLADHRVRAVGRQDVVLLARPESIGKLLEMADGGIPDVVILGDDLPIGEALSIAQMLDNAFPAIELMLVAEADTEVALRAMRVGVREILSPTISGEELRVLVHRAVGNVSNRLNAQAPSAGTPMVGESRVIVIASPKGGVGKSVIAANLTAGLAAHGAAETVLVDLDIQFGDSATLLDLDPAHSIADAVSAAGAIDNVVLKSFITAHPSGFDVLCGADSPTIGDKVSGKDVSRLLDQLSSLYRNIVVDTSAGLNEHTLAALEEASDVVLVSSMDVTSIRALRKEIDILSELRLLPPSSHIVVNMADRNSGLSVRDVEQVLGRPADVVIGRSTDVTVAGSRGELLITAKRPGVTAKALAKLVERVNAGQSKSEQPRASKRLGKHHGSKK